MERGASSRVAGGRPLVHEVRGDALDKLDPREVEQLNKLRLELPYFANKALKIRTKSGKVIPFNFNRPQNFLDFRLEQQRAKLGRVRAIIVKGRQLGSTTYIQGRFYHRLWKSKRALRAYILTHEDDATQNVFNMAKRFFDLHPEGMARPPQQAANAKELIFADNDCGYAVATAGTAEKGRSATFQLFHGSEVAFWPNAESHVTASFQTVGNAPGTELILESTANGVGNLFFRLAQAAIRGQSEYEAIFIPWFWGEDYVAECPLSWEPSKDWQQYGETHDLTWEQLYWAFLQNRTLATSISAPLDKPCWKFLQEYPATFDEAFQTSGNSFIPAAQVMLARKAKVVGVGPVILGVDPARSGDKVGIIDRCGRRMGERIALRMDPGGSSTYVAAQVMAIINRIRPDMVNIDVGSNGGPVYDILCDNGYGDITNAVNFGSNPLTTSATGDDAYFNRRAEMHDLMREWFNQELPTQIPDDDGLQADLTAAEWGPGATRYNTSNELILEEKDAIKKRLGASPDLGDAAALTFAVPYNFTMQSAQTHSRRDRRTKNKKTGY